MTTIGVHCSRCDSPLEPGDLRCAICGVAATAPPEDRPHITVEVLRCKGCGASVGYDPRVKAPRCVFCDSVQELTEITDPMEQTEAFVPFTATASEAGRALSKWLGSLGFFRPSDLRARARLDSLRPIHFAAWVFDATALVSWTADSNAGAQRADWAPHSGQLEIVFDDILVSASRGLSGKETTFLAPSYDLSTAARGAEPPPGPEGALVERFDVQRSQARRTIVDAIHHVAGARLEKGHIPGSRFRNVHVRALLRGLDTRRFAFPAFVLAYRYRGELYRAVVSGQDASRITGTAPWSLARILAVVVGGIAVLLLLALLIFGVVGCTVPPEGNDPAAPGRGGGESPVAVKTTTRSNASSRLAELIEEEWSARLEGNPLLATQVGVTIGQDRLPVVTPGELEQRDFYDRTFMARLRAIEKAELTPRERVDQRMLERQIANRIADYHFGAWQIPLNADSGFHTDLAQLPREMPFRTTHDYECYIARLRALPRHFGEHMANMRTGLERGMTLPRVVLEGYETSIATHVVEDPTESVFFAPFTSFPRGVPPSEHERLSREGIAAIVEAAVPAFRSFLEFLVTDYRPGCRTSLGCSELPEGSLYYAHLVRSFTTLDVSPEQVHEIGKKEVARIQKEMRRVQHEADFEGSFAEFLDFLRTDPRFYASTPEQLLAEASFIAKRMDGKLPAFFGKLPRLPYGVAKVPAHLAPKYTAGRYVPPARGTTEPGYYWVNTQALPSRPLYALTALTLHEAVPGHHLQHALTIELDELPPFRRFQYLSAYGEGWALYCEWLGIEAEMYDDPYDEFGRLTYEMWRACRLVVDTGLHAFGWTRQQAVDFLAERTALSLHEIGTEVDRYISWPGQALSYKMGELEIRRLRVEAEERLGARFDVRSFHDVVLGSGPVPLDVLRALVTEWIESEAAAGS